MTVVTPPRPAVEATGSQDGPELLFPEARRRRRRRWMIGLAVVALCASGAGAGFMLSGSGSGDGSGHAGLLSHTDPPPAAANVTTVSAGELAGGRWSMLVPPQGTLERTWDLAEWTGRYVIAWGSTTPCCTTVPGKPQGGSSDHGAAFDPTKGTWRSLPPAPVDVTVESTTWTGNQVLVWGSKPTGSQPSRNVLLELDPTTWRWRRLAAPTMAPRTGAEVLWSGTRLIVFGGTGPGSSDTTVLSGATYDLRTNRWHALPAVPRYRVAAGSRQAPVGTTAAWDGGTLYVWVARQVSRSAGAGGEEISARTQALRWRPGATRWQPAPVPPKGVSAYLATAVSMGGSIGLLDGSGCLPEMSCPGRVTSSSALLDVKTGTWSTIPADPVLLNAGSFAWTGRRLIALSPFSSGGHPLGGYAASFDPATGAWVDLPKLPVPAAPPSGPVLSGTVWAGTELIESGLVLASGHGAPTTGTIGTSTVLGCPPITYPEQVGGRFCGPAPGPGNGDGVSGSCLGTETAPPCGPGMIAGKYYAYTLITTCTNDYIDGRWWRNELPGGSGPMDVWISVNATGSGAGWIGPDGAVGFAPSTASGCS